MVICQVMDLYNFERSFEGKKANLLKKQEKSFFAPWFKIEQGLLPSRTERNGLEGQGTFFPGDVVLGSESGLITPKIDLEFIKLIF